jgi:hypothetical protein
MDTPTMPMLIHFISYGMAPALLWLVPTYIPSSLEAIPFICYCLFSVSITHMYPAPNNDSSFALFHCISWMFSWCWLTSLCKFFEKLVGINPTDLWFSIGPQSIPRPLNPYQQTPLHHLCCCVRYLPADVGHHIPIYCCP